MPRMKKYTDEEFIKAVSDSLSVAQALTILGLKKAGGNYSAFWDRCKSLSVDTEHFTGQLWSKGRKLEPYIPTEDYLDNKVATRSYRLSRRLRSEGLMENKCYICNIIEYNKLPIVFELDHIDGNRNNNNLSNLRMLCPNCHSQTSTYKGKNKGKYDRGEFRG